MASPQPSRVPFNVFQSNIRCLRRSHTQKINRLLVYLDESREFIPPWDFPLNTDDAVPYAKRNSERIATVIAALSRLVDEIKTEHGSILFHLNNALSTVINTGTLQVINELMAIRNRFHSHMVHRQVAVYLAQATNMVEVMSARQRELSNHSAIMDYLVTIGVTVIPASVTISRPFHMIMLPARAAAPISN